MTDILFHKTAQGRELAFHRLEGEKPGVLFLGGFKSDMTGTKAMALESWCRQRGRAFLRFDYSGHGQSSGAFEEGTIGRWTEDAEEILTQIADGPQILVGSSMGGWIMLLLALRHTRKITGLLGIAAAPDFTEYHVWQEMTDLQKKEMEQTGMVFIEACPGDEPYPITRQLIEDGRKHLLLDKNLEIGCPVMLLHGMGDEDVPWQSSLKIAEKLKSRQVEITLVKNGGHRMSEPDELGLLCQTLERLVAKVAELPSLRA